MIALMWALLVLAGFAGFCAAGWRQAASEQRVRADELEERLRVALTPPPFVPLPPTSICWSIQHIPSSWEPLFEEPYNALGSPFTTDPQ